jgi:hypothetical protein
VTCAWRFLKGVSVDGGVRQWGWVDAAAQSDEKAAEVAAAAADGAAVDSAVPGRFAFAGSQHEHGNHYPVQSGEF